MAAMKRRINTLASSTSKGDAVKKRSWKDSDDDSEEPPPTKAKATPAESDDELLKEAALEDAAGMAPRLAAPGRPNPVVWLEVSVAGTPRGRIYFELFHDVAPKASENFRRLCAGMDVDGNKVSLKSIELDSIISGKYASGDLDRPVELPAIEREATLRHARGGLLTMPIGSPSFGSSRFQVTFRPTPEMDGKQVVFGQLLLAPDSAGKLHPLHWVESVGAASGTPWEAVAITDCGESGANEAEKMLGAMVMAAQIDRTAESEDARYGRAGIYGRLKDALSEESLEEVLELTEEVIYHVEYEAKKAKLAAEKDRKAKELEVIITELKDVLADVEHKAGDVVGFDGKLGRKTKGQLIRIKELDQSLTRLY